MVIQTNYTLKPGEVIRSGSVSDHNGEYRPLTFRVLREATFEEFEQYCKDEGSPIDPWPRERFYLISPD